jgi:hypothetical protein
VLGDRGAYSLSPGSGLSLQSGDRCLSGKFQERAMLSGVENGILLSSKCGIEHDDIAVRPNPELIDSEFMRQRPIFEGCFQFRHEPLEQEPKL